MHFLILQMVIMCAIITVESATNFLQSTPIHIGGTLTTCAGETLSLTCIHNNHATGITRWIFSNPINCSETIDHNPPIFTDLCGPFRFQNVAEIGFNESLNSTTTTIASASMNGTIIECRDSSGTVFNSIGSIKLCIIGKHNMIILLL